jgi:hypothetical protein
MHLTTWLKETSIHCIGDANAQWPFAFIKFVLLRNKYFYISFINKMTNKRKIINDPVYDGFLTIEDDIIFDVISHRYFQRQRRIKQLGFTYLVYPGAMHTRFSHMLGALNLMTRALDVLKVKGVEIIKALSVVLVTSFILILCNSICSNYSG